MPVTHYIWDFLNDTLLCEMDENGHVTATYTHEAGFHGKLLSQHRDGVTSYYHYDAQGSVRLVTDDNQNVTDTYTYTAFGELVARTGLTENPFQFQGAHGAYTDAELAEHYFRERHYQAQTARWTSPDPLGHGHAAAGLAILATDGNLYAYVGNNPVMFADPSGMLREAMNAPGASTANALACDCGERTILIPSVALYVEILDVELPENIVPTGDEAKTRKFGRSKPGRTQSKQGIKALLEVENHRVVCCKTDSQVRLLERAKIGDTTVKQDGRSVPTPPGPATDKNMDAVARCGFPVPFVYHSRGEDDRTRCLELAFPNANFGPVAITTKTNLEACAKQGDGGGGKR